MDFRTLCNEIEKLFEYCEFTCAAEVYEYWCTHLRQLETAYDMTHSFIDFHEEMSMGQFLITKIVSMVQQEIRNLIMAHESCAIAVITDDTTDEMYELLKSLLTQIQTMIKFLQGAKS